MGNCGNKPLTTEGEAPAPEQKVEEREIEVDQNKVPSLAQMLEDDGKKPGGEGVAKEEVVEAKKEDAPKPEASEPKKEETKPAEKKVEEKKSEAK